MSKIIKTYVRRSENIIRKVIGIETFQFSAPKQFSCTFTAEELGRKNWKSIKHFSKYGKAIINKRGKFIVKNHTVSDNAVTTLEMLPLPAPNVVIRRKNDLIRYETTFFVAKNGILVSMKQAALSEKGVGIAGVNLSGKERKIVQGVRDLLGRKVLNNPILFNRVVDLEENIDNQTYDAKMPPEAALAEALIRLPLPIFWASVHAFMATLMPFLNEDAKAFYYPALRLSEEESTKQAQYSHLRDVLGDFCFARDASSNTIRLPELTLQDADSIATLKIITGLPVLAQIDRDAVRKDVTEMMQQAHCEIVATGFAKHPFRTIPLLIGERLPADNAIFAFDWDVFERAHPEDVATLRAAFAALLQHLPDVTETINWEISRMTLNGMKYSECYFLTFCEVLDSMLFRSSEARDIFFSKAQDMVSAYYSQETEKFKRFETAAQLLTNPAQWKDLVAKSSKDMKPNHLGFHVKLDGNVEAIAFELNHDFPELMHNRLGLHRGDSLQFRKYLRRHGQLKCPSQNERGRNRLPASHVVFPLPIGCAEAKNSVNN